MYKPQSKCNGRSNCTACLLRHEMVCANITLDDLFSFHTRVDDYVFPHTAILYNAASPIDTIHCIRHGAIKLVKYDADGGQRIVRVLKRGDVAGIESIFTGICEHTAIAIGEVRTCSIPLAFFRQFVDQRSALQIGLLKMSQEVLRETKLWLLRLTSATTPVRTRVARLLLRLRDGDTHRIHRLSLEEMGAILGVAQESVSRAMAEFARIGVLARAGNTYANRHFRGDIAALEIIADER